MAAYSALLKPGDTVLGMKLDQGGHLSHGSPVNFSGQTYNFVAYGVNRETELVDMEEVERLAVEHRPAAIVAGYTAYPRTVDFAPSAPSPTPWGRSSSWTWPTLPGSSRGAHTPPPCPTPRR